MNASDVSQRGGGGSGSKYLNLETYRTVNAGNWERESGIEPVKLLCDRSLQHTVYICTVICLTFKNFAQIHYNLQGLNG